MEAKARSATAQDHGLTGLLRRKIALRWRIAAALLLVSLLPLGVLSIGAWSVFGRLLLEKSLELQRTVVEGHARSIDLYLAERLRALDLAARGYRREELRDPQALRQLLETLNHSYDHSFIDLGVIGSDGRHLAYAGPYNLLDRNYAETEWFLAVCREGVHVSDVFLGFRQVPHCILAVQRLEGDGFWILRATINSEQFDRLVHTGRLGRTGDAFLVNAAGLYQTPPKEGRVLERADLPIPANLHGVLDSRVTEGGRRMRRVTTWLHGGRWLLVVQQDEAEIMAPVRRAMAAGALVVFAAVALVAAATILSTWHLTGRIEEAVRERDALSRDLLRSAKLASLGEMATGLAHEINNPLAIISAEQTNIVDLVGEIDAPGEAGAEILDSARRCLRQVERCAVVTSKMLQFGRQAEARRRPTDVQPRLEEIARLMGGQAVLRGVDLQLEVEPGLPPLLLDPTEIEQVLVNLVHNALQATGSGGRVRITARREGSTVLLQVADSGCGIPPENLERVFQPFFTTKPLGEGTGLGLAVCYGIVQSWGGTIRAESEPGQGTVMTIRLPLTAQEASARARG
jgi:two-component system NtrC family sensor kinase